MKYINLKPLIMNALRIVTFKELNNQNLFPMGNTNSPNTEDWLENATNIQIDFDPCEKGRGLSAAGHFGSAKYLMDYEQRDNCSMDTLELLCGAEEEYSHHQDLFNDFEDEVFSNTAKKNAGCLDLNCHKTLEYYYMRDVEMAKAIEVIVPIEVSPYLRTLSQKKYSHEGRKLKTAPRTRFLVAS